MKKASQQQVIVVKIGGTAGLDRAAIIQDIAALWESGQSIVLVHGGSEDASQVGEAIGHPARFVTSPSGFTSRFTDEGTVDVFTMAVNGRFNTGLVTALAAHDVLAFGLSGADGDLIRARRKSAIRIVENEKVKMLRGDFTGKIVKVNGRVLNLLLSNGFLPVVAPLALSENYEIVTTDADRAAAAVAGALGADQLVLLTAVPGLLREFPDESTLVRTLGAADLEQALQWAQDRMKKKVLAAGEALAAGVKQVIIADGRQAEPVSKALDGAGTVIQ